MRGVVTTVYKGVKYEYQPVLRCFYVTLKDGTVLMVREDRERLERILTPCWDEVAPELQVFYRQIYGDHFCTGVEE